MAAAGSVAMFGCRSIHRLSAGDGDFVQLFSRLAEGEDLLRMVHPFSYCRDSVDRREVPQVRRVLPLGMETSLPQSFRAKVHPLPAAGLADAQAGRSGFGYLDFKLHHYPRSLWIMPRF